MFDKILVPIDGSEHSSKAIEMAVQIAKKFHGKITLIHVYSVSVTPVMMPEPSTFTPPAAPIMAPVEISKITEGAREAGKRILSDGEDKVKAEKVPVDTLMNEGHTVQEIIRTAKEGKYDLIVIGARGISHVRELLLGSVTDGVIHHAVCPIMVVKLAPR